MSLLIFFADFQIFFFTMMRNLWNFSNLSQKCLQQQKPQMVENSAVN